MVDFDVAAEAGGFADDDPGAVVDEEVRANLGTGVDIGAGALVGVLGKHAREKRNAEAIELVGDALQRDREDARVGEDDFLDAARGGVAPIGGLHIGLHDVADFGETAKERHGQLVGAGLGGGVAGEA